MWTEKYIPWLIGDIVKLADQVDKRNEEQEQEDFFTSQALHVHSVHGFAVSDR